MAEEPKKVVEVSKDEIEKGKTMAIVTYLGLIGFIVALATDGKKNEFTRFHMNQALPLVLAVFVSWIPFIGWLVALGVLVLWIMGIIAAANGEMKRLPIVGNIELIK
jgi:uncharacterized membrane protein